MTKIVVLLAAGVVSVSLHAANDAVRRLETSAIVLDEIMAAPDKGIPQDLFNKSACVVIVPGLKKGAFIVGGKFGKGFIECRKEGGAWSAPAAIRVEGGSVGFQIGGSETDVVLLVMNQRGMDKLLSSKFTIGADAAAAAGPVGRTSTAETDAQMHAEILSWSRARGIFAGISLEGATLRPDDDSNRDLYGRPLTNKEIVTGEVTPPPAASKLIEDLSKYSGK
ncbi:MAG: lipid-binding SYLF domain-containing protein [Bryobacteraceae bacterium]|jgi:lipid-binding SYLF domain-containing protein